MYYYCCTVGTETAVGSVTLLRAETTYISITWTQPDYSPLGVRLDYQYSLFCETQPYFTTQIYAPLHYKGMNFTRMKPGSVCKATFAVIYNPSEFDRGVDYLFETLQLRKAYVDTLYSAWFSLLRQ